MRGRVVVVLLTTLLAGAVWGTRRVVGSSDRSPPSEPANPHTDSPAADARVDVEPIEGSELVGGWPVDWIPVHGRIFRDGEPCGSVPIRAVEHLPQGRSTWWVSDEVEADEDGRFVVGVPRPGCYWIDVELQRHSPAGSLGIMRPITVELADVAEHRVEVLTGVVSGRVFGPHSEPVARCRVGFTQVFAFVYPGGEDRFDSADPRGSGHAWTDDAGHYAITLPVGDVELRALDDPADPRPFLGDFRRIRVDSAAVREDVDFRLSSAGHVAGKVKRRNGTLVPDAEIWIRPRHMGEPLLWTRSKPDGSFRVKEAPGSMGLLAVCDVGESRWEEILVTANEVVELDLVVD